MLFANKEKFLMTDPFPQFTILLDEGLAWLIWVGIILAGVSAVLVGLAYLPIFAFLLNEQREMWARNALRGTVIGLGIILVALPLRNWVILHYFPLPAGLPPIPLSKPFPSLTPTKVQ